MIVLGLISGTSLDAIDVAVADLSWRDDRIVLRPLRHAEMPWPAATRARLVAALPPAATTMAEICALDVLAGEAFAEAAAAFTEGVELIASHGQTLFHWIEAGHARGTLQIGQPACIVERTGLPVISDIRARDIAAGGQGAPLASTLDALWLADPAIRRAALNLGGIANVTIVGAPEKPILAFDTGPANCLLDIEATRITEGVQASDIDGRIARGGQVRRDLLDRLLGEPYYGRPAPKSTGRELFTPAYVQPFLENLPTIADADRMATLVELTAITVADACRAHCVDEVIASGGGMRNPALTQALRRQLGAIRLIPSEQRGLPSEGKEAYLMALLGFLTWHQVPGVLPGATGSPIARVLGRLSPGNLPMRLPPPGPRPSGLILEN